MAGHFLVSPASRDFTLLDVEKMSATKVHALFADKRWGPGGKQTCPDCAVVAKHYFVKARRQYRCREVACGKSFSVTTGTKFADHKLPLKTILKAMVIFATNVKGISACALSRQIGVAYQTAFVLLHKLRESIIEDSDKSQLDGLVHIDGAHVSGRIRKPRVKAPATKTQARSKVPMSAFETHPNRRIVMALRGVSPIRGVGSMRTIVEIVSAENMDAANKLAKLYVKSGATIMTDEHPAYSEYSARYKHLTVNHTVEFSTDEGVSNNQAESYFARLRRLVAGQIHRLTPKYMLDYATEVAWREDVRRKATSVQVDRLIGMSQRSMSSWWLGYWQGKNREYEVLFTSPQGQPSRKSGPAAPSFRARSEGDI